MRRPLLTLTCLLVLASNCGHEHSAWVVAPAPPVALPVEGAILHGTVRLGDWHSPPGPLVYMAKVWLSGDRAHAVYTDSLGEFALPVSSNGFDSVTVVARDGYTPGMAYAVTCSGSRTVALSTLGTAHVEIRLDACMPI